MSTAILEMPRTSIHVERTCACPFSMADEYAVQYFKQAEAGGPQAVVGLAGHAWLPAMGRKVNVSFGLEIDGREPGRQHTEIRLRWKSGSRLFPNFRGTVRFRILGIRTLVVIDGSYLAPLGKFGWWFDRVIGRRIAARTLDNLARRLISDLEKKEFAWRAMHERTGV